VLAHRLADEHLIFVTDLDDRPRRETMGTAQGPDEQSLVDERGRGPGSGEGDDRVRAAGEPAPAEAGGRARRFDDDTPVDPHATGRRDPGRIERAADQDRGYARELGPRAGPAIEREPFVAVQWRDRSLEGDLERR
jgi:hypothetical protein